MAKKNKKVVEKDVMVHIMSNTPNEYLVQIFQMFYRGVHLNTIGVMEAKEKNNDNKHLLLVGLKINSDGTVAESYPLAKILHAGETANYVAPDGKGGWQERP